MHGFHQWRAEFCTGTKDQVGTSRQGDGAVRHDDEIRPDAGCRLNGAAQIEEWRCRFAARFFIADEGDLDRFGLRWRHVDVVVKIPGITRESECACDARKTDHATSAGWKIAGDWWLSALVPGKLEVVNLGVTRVAETNAGGGCSSFSGSTFLSIRGEGEGEVVAFRCCDGHDFNGDVFRPDHAAQGINPRTFLKVCDDDDALFQSAQALSAAKPASSIHQRLSKIG